jgi:ribosomal protein L13E
LASNIRKSNNNKDLAVKIGNRVGRGITTEELEKSLSDHLKHVKGRSFKK